MLSPEHNDQLVEYLRFLRRKRDGAVAEVSAEFKEVKESRLFDEMYSQDDVLSVLDGLLSVVRSTMKRDLQTTMFSSVLLLKQVFEQAEKDGTTLTTDLPMTEHRDLVAAVEQWDSSVHSGGTGTQLRVRAAMAARPAGGGALPLIGQTQDPRLLADLQSTKDDNISLQERFQRLQVQCQSVLKEKSAMQAEIEAMRQGSASGTADAHEEAAALRAQV